MPRCDEAMRLHAADRSALEQHLAAIGRVKAGDHVDAGGLARAVRADQAQHLAAAQIERQPSSARKPPKRLTRAARPCRSGGAGQGTSMPRRCSSETSPFGRNSTSAMMSEAVDELEILRRRDADGVVDAVEDNHAEDRPEQRRGAAEQREHDGEDGECRRRTPSPDRTPRCARRRRRRRARRRAPRAARRSCARAPR